MDVVHFETLGCKLNQIEMESLASAFTESGYGIHIPDGEPGTDEPTEAPQGEGTALLKPLDATILSVVNTCTVTGKAEQKARRLIRLLLRNHPGVPVLVTGCYAEVEAEAIEAINPLVIAFPGSRKGELASLPAWLSAWQLRHGDAPLIEGIREFIASGSPVSEISTFRLAADTFLFHSRASIKIQDGCNNMCTYCRIRLARGKAVSLDTDEVIERLRRIEDGGWGEAVLTGVNLSQYRSGDLDFAGLLGRILTETRDIRIRISSLYPERVDEAILPLLAHERICPHFHLSVQSGSDRILSLMKRPYGAQMVWKAAERLRSVKENPFLACDIITGFPGETEEDFQATLDMCASIGFAWIHAFPYSPRPGTAAWNMKPRVPERVAGERVRILTELAHKNRAAYEEYWVGRTLSGIIERGPDALTEHVVTGNYLTLTIPSTGLPKGTPVAVKAEGKGTAILVKSR